MGVVRRSNNWIVVDRLQSKSPTAEFLLELALDQAAQKPTVIVIDAEDRLRNFYPTTPTGQTSKARVALLTPEAPLAHAAAMPAAPRACRFANVIFPSLHSYRAMRVRTVGEGLQAWQTIERFAKLRSYSAPLGSDVSMPKDAVEWLYHPSEFSDARVFENLPPPRDLEDAHVDPATGRAYPEMAWWYACKHAHTRTFHTAAEPPPPFPAL